jgi:regulator of RNase E activity RraB
VKKKEYTTPTAYMAAIQVDEIMTALSVCTASLNGWGTETELGTNTTDSDGDVFVAW